MANNLSAQPFSVSLRALMEERSLTYRGLARAIAAIDDKGVSHAHLNMLANGREKPTMRVMELVATACAIDPEYFAEYRLGGAMRELDPAEVGLEQALANLNSRMGARRRSSATRRPGQAPRAQSHPTG